MYEILILPENNEGYHDIPSLLCELGQQGITSLLVEGGMTIHQQFFKKGLFNKFQAYVTCFYWKFNAKTNDSKCNLSNIRK